jgi:hypothetical protein
MSISSTDVMELTSDGDTSAFCLTRFLLLKLEDLVLVYWTLVASESSMADLKDS